MVTIEEISIDELNEFWEQHIKYLVDDEIITDAEDVNYFTSNAYRGVIKTHMERKENRHHLVYFLENQQRIGACSYCIYSNEDEKCFILDFWIFEEFRGKGFGHMCYQLLENSTKLAGAKFYELNSSKEISIRFWKSNGYVENGIDEYGDKLFIKF